MENWLYIRTIGNGEEAGRVIRKIKNLIRVYVRS